MSAEQVLVTPTRIFEQLGRFQGLSRDVEKYLPRLLAAEHLQFMPRVQAEDDPRFKQIIPYVVLRCGDQVFHYTRGQGAGEKRLRTRRSVGIGGHINPCDHGADESAYRAGMRRELAEEVVLETSYRERCLGLINDDATPVGQVHLGIVHVFDLEAPAVQLRETELLHSGFATPQALLASAHEFESWSQFVLRALAGEPAARI